VVPLPQRASKLNRTPAPSCSGMIREPPPETGLRRPSYTRRLRSLGGAPTQWMRSASTSNVPPTRARAHPFPPNRGAESRILESSDSPGPSDSQAVIESRGFVSTSKFASPWPYGGSADVPWRTNHARRSTLTRATSSVMTRTHIQRTSTTRCRVHLLAPGPESNRPVGAEGLNELT